MSGARSKRALRSAAAIYVLLGFALFFYQDTLNGIIINCFAGTNHTIRSLIPQ